MTTSRSKAKGTAAESAVVKAAQAAGFTAQRCALAGGRDVGDVHVQHGQIVIEVKAGKAAESASIALCQAWWAETAAEADRVPQCDLAVLVVKRRGVGNPRGWRAFVRMGELCNMWGIGAELSAQAYDLTVELPFGRLLDVLADIWQVSS